jgi:multiple sugar transport system substrate-binding protein
MEEEKMKRVTMSVLVLLLAAVTVFAGGGKQSGGSSSGPVTLRVGIWDQNQAAGITRVLADFTAETGIRTSVEVTPWNDYWTLLEAATSGGSLPDVFWMHSNESQKYMSNKVLMDLTDRISKSNVAKMANFPPEIVALYALNGRQYAIPKDLDTIALWYNKKLFDEAGVPYPTDRWNWDNLKDAAKKLTNTSKGQYGILFTPGETQTGYWNQIYQNGGTVISNDKKKSGFDDPRTIAAMEYVVSFIKEGAAPDLTVAESDAMALMQGGVVAMSQFGSWMLSSFKANDYCRQNCDMVMLPSSNSGQRATIYNGLGWSASANTRYQEEAWKLLEFLSREDTQRKLSETGIAISAFKGTADPFTRGFPEFNVKGYIDQIPYAVMRPYSKNTNTWENMSVQTLNDVWMNRMAVADACRSIAQRMNTTLAAE